MAKKKANEELGSWMDTYGDLVTLLMTFFILLYSMSSLDAAKWDIFVKSIYPTEEDIPVERIVIDGIIGQDGDATPGTPPVTELLPAMSVEEIYMILAQKMNEAGAAGVTVSRGDGYTFIMFEDKTFFDGDSSVLTQQGEMLMDVFCNTIAPVADQISQVNIMAHTAKAREDTPEIIRTDRMLSAMRSAEVCIFIQNQEIIEPEKLVNISYGRFRPIETNDTSEGRARNRRVEILLVDEGTDVNTLNKYYDEFNAGVNADSTIVTDGQPGSVGTTDAAPGAEGTMEMVPGTQEPVTQ